MKKILKIILCFAITIIIPVGFSVSANQIYTSLSEWYKDAYKDTAENSDEIFAGLVQTLNLAVANQNVALQVDSILCFQDELTFSFSISVPEHFQELIQTEHYLYGKQWNYFVLDGSKTNEEEIISSLLDSHDFDIPELQTWLISKKAVESGWYNEDAGRIEGRVAIEVDQAKPGDLMVIELDELYVAPQGSSGDDLLADLPDEYREDSPLFLVIPLNRICGPLGEKAFFYSVD